MAQTASRAEGWQRARVSTAIQVLAAITLAGAVLRFATLGVQSVWLDESATLALLHRSFGSMLSGLPSSESTPPVYYVLAWLWTRVFGTDAVAVRALSALIGTATIPLAYCAAAAAGRRAGLWAAALVAVSPLGFYYSQEARVYALLMLVCGVGFVLWQRALADPTPRRLRWWALVACVSLATHYFALFVVVGEAIVLIRRLGWRRIALELGAIVLVGAALLPLALRQREDGKSEWIEDSSLLSRVAQAPKQFLVGIDGPAELVTAVLAIALAAGALALIWRRGDERERRVALGGAWVVGVALLIPALCSVSGVIDVLNGRNVVASWVVVIAVIAVGLGTERAPRRLTAVLGGGLCAVFAAVVAGVLADPTVQRDDWRGVARTLQKLPARPRVLAAPANSDLPLGYYLDGIATVGVDTPVRTRELDVVSLRVRRTARGSLPPPAPLGAPAGFRLVARHATSTYAVSRYVAATPTAITTRSVARAAGATDVRLLTDSG